MCEKTWTLGIKSRTSGFSLQLINVLFTTQKAVLTAHNELSIECTRLLQRTSVKVSIVWSPSWGLLWLNAPAKTRGPGFNSRWQPVQFLRHFVRVILLIQITKY